EMQRSSQTALPAMVAPASSVRVTTVASMSGTKPSSAADPFIIGTPATHTLSLTTTRLPASGPSAAPRISHRQYQALNGLSDGSGRCPAGRGYFGASGAGSGNCSTASIVPSRGTMSSRYEARSSSDRTSPNESAISRSCPIAGGSIGIAHLLFRATLVQRQERGAVSRICESMRSPRRALRSIAFAVAVGLLAAGQTSLGALAADASLVSSASNGSGLGRVSISIDRPPGTSAGHVMVASVVISDDDPAFTAPAGWTLVRQDSIKDMLRQAVYVKVATADEPTSYTWTVPSARRMAGGITTFSGIDATNPIDAVNGQINNAGTAVTAPAVTTSVGGTVLVELAAVASDGVLTPPVGMAEAWEAAAPGASTRKNTRGAVASLSQATQPTAGLTGSRTATVSIAGRSIGVLLALRPVPAPDTSPPNTTIASGPSGTTTNSFATFTFSATEPATFLCQLDPGSAAEPCSSPKTYVNLAAGDHTFAVWATDAMGNADPTPATRGWTISPDSGDPVLVGAGDIAYCGNDNDEATAELLDNMPGTVVTLGDNAYDNGSLTNFSDCYGPTWGRHKARTTPAIGNHEYVTSAASGYFSYFGAAAGDPTQGYYDYQLGAWHVIVLNSNCTQIGGCGAGSPEEQWLRNVRASSQAECTVAVWHHPRFSSGTSHGSNVEMQ